MDRGLDCHEFLEKWSLSRDVPFKFHVEFPRGERPKPKMFPAIERRAVSPGDSIAVCNVLSVGNRLFQPTWYSISPPVSSTKGSFAFRSQPRRQWWEVYWRSGKEGVVNAVAATSRYWKNLQPSFLEDRSRHSLSLPAALFDRFVV